MKNLIYISFSLFFLFSCNSNTSGDAAHNGNHATAQAKGPSQVTHLSAKDFKAKMDELSNEQLIDVRRPDEVGNGYIPNAININIGEADFNTKIQALNKEQPIMVYCAAGGRSKKACASLRELGYNNIYELDSGFRGWLREKYPVAK